MLPHWEHFAHVADIGIRGFGPTREAAFEQAALALVGAVTDPIKVDPATPVEVACGPQPNDDLLLYAWLNALVYEIGTRQMLFGRFAVRLTADGLQGCAWGEAIDRSKHRPAVEVKGATLTELAVRRVDEGWLAQCVIDV